MSDTTVRIPFSSWILATRPKTLVAGAVPVLVGPPVSGGDSGGGGGALGGLWLALLALAAVLVYRHRATPNTV